jgi:dipicolinate synthase subunit B
MDFDKYNIGFGITGSFCTFAKAKKEVELLCGMGANVIPIFSFQAQTTRKITIYTKRY